MRETKWSPDVIGDLFFDAQDYRGIEFWYNDLIAMQEEMKQKTSGR